MFLYKYFGSCFYLISYLYTQTYVSCVFHCRVLIIFRNGQMILWDVQESRSILRTGGSKLQPLHNETKKVTSACWVCPFGSKVAIGYNNGELFIWRIPSLNIGNVSASECINQNTPFLKLNLGYKSEKISIGSIKWVYAGGKASRLYVMGASDYATSNLLQVFECLFKAFITKYLVLRQII